MLASCSQCGETSVDPSRRVVCVAVHGGHMMHAAWIAYLFVFSVYCHPSDKGAKPELSPFLTLSVVYCQRVLSVTACL